MGSNAEMVALILRNPHGMDRAPSLSSISDLGHRTLLHARRSCRTGLQVGIASCCACAHNRWNLNSASYRHALSSPKLRWPSWLIWFRRRCDRHNALSLLVMAQLPDWRDAVATGHSRSASGDFCVRTQISVVLAKNVCVSTGVHTRVKQ
jgi:hypothetical protein